VILFRGKGLGRRQGNAFLECPSLGACVVQENSEHVYIVGKLPHFIISVCEELLSQPDNNNTAVVAPTLNYDVLHCI